MLLHYLVKCQGHPNSVIDWIQVRAVWGPHVRLDERCHDGHYNSETINPLFPVVNFLNSVVTEVVLFSIVAFKTLDISQGSVATHLRCGGIFSDSIITNFLVILTVK